MPETLNAFVLSGINDTTIFSCDGGWLNIHYFDEDEGHTCIVLNYGEVQELAKAFPAMLELLEKQHEANK